MFSIDITEKITDHFTWDEALWLSLWDIHCFPTKEQYQNIIDVAYALEKIRDLIGKPIRVHSWLRPDAYNRHIGGARNSAHKEGKACDFSVPGMEAHEVREFLKRNNCLEVLEIRMEKLPKASSWIHIDIREPGPSGRYFKP